MVKRVLGLALVVVAFAACAKTPPPAPTDKTGFGTEAPTSRPASGMGDNSAFRTVYFDFDRSDLRADAREGLQANRLLANDHGELRQGAPGGRGSQRAGLGEESPRRLQSSLIWVERRSASRCPSARCPCSALASPFRSSNHSGAMSRS